MKKITQVLVILAFFFYSHSITAQVSGDLDTTFNPTDTGFGIGDGPNNSVYPTAIQTDGKIIVGGGFTTYNGTLANRIVRLNPNGTLDTTFTTGTGANSYVRSISIQTDGKIIISGDFTTYNNIPAISVARLNTDGTLDATFNAGTGANSYVYATAIQVDGKIIIVGDFTIYNGTSVNRIARLNTDGTLDPTFSIGTGANVTVRSIAIQSDGKIIIGGDFFTFNSTTATRIARLNTDGTLDPTFTPGTGPSNSVYSINFQTDGKIIIAGGFSTYNDINTRCLVRLNTDGTLDPSFTLGLATSTIFSTAIQSDGKIIIGGDFTSFSGVSIYSVVRVNTNGTLDATFFTSTVPLTAVRSTAILADGKIIIGGDFTSYNGATAKYIARLNTNGTLDTAFNAPTGADNKVYSIAVQTDGKIIIGGDFTVYNGTSARRIARLNTDGTLDPTFNMGTGINSFVRSITIQTDGKIIIGGGISNYNGTNASNIMRLNSDGTLDATFTPGVGPWNVVYSTAIQTNGKIIIGGEFQDYGATLTRRIARLNTNGTIDPTFVPSTGANNTVYSTAIQTDGKIIIGGDFTVYKGISVNRIARLNTDATFDNTFTGTGTNGRVSSTAIQTDGKIIVGGSFTTYNGTPANGIIRLNTDGTLDSTFLGTGTNGSVSSITIQTNGKIIIGGDFTTYNGTPANRIIRLNNDGTLDATFIAGTGANNAVLSTAIQADVKILIGGSLTGYNGIGRNRIARIHNTDILSTQGFDVLSNFKVYPNPSLGIYNIVSDVNAIMEVYDVIGKQMTYKKISVGTSILDISNYDEGIYLLKVTNENNQSKIMKVIKQ